MLWVFLYLCIVSLFCFWFSSSHLTWDGVCAREYAQIAYFCNITFSASVVSAHVAYVKVCRPSFCCFFLFFAFLNSQTCFIPFMHAKDSRCRLFIPFSVLFRSSKEVFRRNRVLCWIYPLTLDTMIFFKDFLGFYFVCRTNAQPSYLNALLWIFKWILIQNPITKLTIHLLNYFCFFFLFKFKMKIFHS